MHADSIHALYFYEDEDTKIYQLSVHMKECALKDVIMETILPIWPSLLSSYQEFINVQVDFSDSVQSTITFYIFMI